MSRSKERAIAWRAFAFEVFCVGRYSTCFRFCVRGEQKESVRQDVRELQAARVSHRVAVHAGGLAALPRWCAAMDHHGAAHVLLPMYNLLHAPRRVCREPHQSAFQRYYLVHRPNTMLTIRFYKNYRVSTRC